MRKILVPVALLAVLFALLLTQCGGTSSPEPPHNLLLIVVDTLRQDHLGCYGYDAHPSSPAIDELAREGIQWVGLTGVSSWTQPSVATLLTGLKPSGHKIARLFQPLTIDNTLAEVLKNEGYATGCIMSNFLLPKSRRNGPTGYARGFDFYDDRVAKKADPHADSTAATVTDYGIGWLKSRHGDQPWFLMVHYFDPHVVYEDNPDYEFLDLGYSGWVRGGLKKADLQQHQETANDTDRRQLGALYAEEVRAVDDAIGRLLAAVRDRDDFEDTVVVFTTDHGEELSERGYIGHTVTLHFEQVDLPLIVRLPGAARAGERIVARRSQTHLYATLLELVGAPNPVKRGKSFAAELLGTAPPASQPCFSEVDFVPSMQANAEKTKQKRAVHAHDFKLVRDLKLDTWQLYDTANDPDELVDVYGDPAHAAISEKLHELHRRYPWLVLK